MANRYWVGGTGSWSSTNTTNWSESSGGSGGASVPTSADNVFFDAGSDAGGIFTVTMANSPRVCNDFTASGLDFTMTLGGGSVGLTVSGSLTFPATNFTRSYIGTTTFNATTTGKTVTINGVGFGGAITFNGVGGGWTLGSALTTINSATTTLTNGTLDLASYTLSTGRFSSTNSNTRTIAFGTGQISCTSVSGTLWNTGNVTGLTTTGTQVVNITSTGSSSVVVNTGSLSEANSISFNFTGGAYDLDFAYLVNDSVRSIDFTGFNGYWLHSTPLFIYGDLKLSSGMYIDPTGEFTFGATSGTKNITTNGQTLDKEIIFDGVGGTFVLQDALTMGYINTDPILVEGTVTLTNGTLDLNGKTMTVGTTFTTETGTKNLTFNGGTLICPTASSTAFNNAQPTNFTTTAGTGTGKISMTAATAKTFVGGGSTFNCTLNQGGAGALTITGSNTFNDITNTVQPASVLFTAGTTSTFSNFTVSGTAGNLITIGSDTGAATHTLSKASGTVSADYLSISYSVATGGATWYAGANSTDGGNNSGWTFTAPPVNRYWVGGTGTWDQTSTAHWSTTSGGSPGASAPTYTDLVFFDANSGGGTVDVQDTGGATLPSCESLDFSGFTGSFDSSSGVLEVFGDITLSAEAGSDFTLFTPNIYGTSCTLYTQTKPIKDLYAGGVSATTGLEYSPTVTLYNNVLTCNGVFVFSQGTFNTSSYAVSAQYFLWGTANAVRSTTINMEDGYFAILNSVSPGQGWGISYHTSPSEVTVNAGTSIIDFVNIDNSLVACSMYLYNGATSSISSSGKTYYQLHISQNASSGSQITIYGNNTFDRIRVFNSSLAITLTFAAGSTQTTSSFYAEGAAGGVVTLQSTSPGTQFTLYQATGIVSEDYLSLRDSAATGGAIWYAGAHSTNVSNNTGWTFTAQPPVNRYWVGGSGTWDTRDVTHWSATSGGAGGVYAPTSIDTVFIDANSGSGTIIVNDNFGSPEVSSLDFTGFTGTIVGTQYDNTELHLYGNLTLGSGGDYGAYSQSLIIIFYSNATMVSNGTNNPYLEIVIGEYGFGGAVLTLGDEIKVGYLGINNATLNTNNYDVTTNYFESYNESTLNFGSSSITLSYFYADYADTVNAGTSTINVGYDVYQDPDDWEFHGGDHTYYNLNFLTDADTGGVYGGVYDSNTFHSITNSVQPINVILYNGTTQTITGTFGVAGTSGNLVTLRSTLPYTGIQFSLVKASGTVSTDYLSLQDSNATGGAAWYAGANSTNVSNNTGWTFTAPPGGTPIVISAGVTISGGVTIG